MYVSIHYVTFYLSIYLSIYLPEASILGPVAPNENTGVAKHIVLPPPPPNNFDNLNISYVMQELGLKNTVMHSNH